MLYVIMSLYKNDTLPVVKEAIYSIISQTYHDFQLYIVFDGPVNDSVGDFLRCLDDQRLFLIERSKNQGLAYSMNELLRLILPLDCSYVARMDADDISFPERFEKQIEYMELHTDVDCLGTWAIEFDREDREFFRKKMPVTHNECLELFKKRDCIIHPTVMFRKSYFEKAGLYPEDTYFGEDTMMWAQGFKNGCRFANLPLFLFKFRLDTNFFERRRGWKHAQSIFKLRRQVNKMLGFGIKEDCSALLYAIAKLMPKSVLNIVYKVAR